MTTTYTAITCLRAFASSREIKISTCMNTHFQKHESH